MNSNVSRGMGDRTLPTAPEPFGYKTAWFAVQSEDTNAVAAALELQNPEAANWEYGLWHSSGYDGYRIFVSPPVSGWILATGMPILYEADDHAAERMVDLSRQFSEVQFFASMRISSSYVWARASNGRLIRLFYEGDGTRRVLGEETEAERELGFKFFDSSSPESSQPGYWERKDLTYPDEEHVLQVAGKWSIDPSTLDQMNLPPALGLLGDPSASYPPKPAPIQPNRSQKRGLLARLFGR